VGRPAVARPLAANGAGGQCISKTTQNTKTHSSLPFNIQKNPKSKIPSFSPHILPIPLRILHDFIYPDLSTFLPIHLPLQPAGNDGTRAKHAASILPYHKNDTTRTTQRSRQWHPGKKKTGSEHYTKSTQNDREKAVDEMI
jgi:hypothetical protein